MTAATKTPPIDAEKLVLPPGAADWEMPGFIPMDTGIEWLDGFGEIHLAAVAEYAEAVHAADSHEDVAAEAMRAWRRAAREAVAAGKAMPKKPEVDDSEVMKEVLVDDVNVAREKLAEVVVDVLDGIQRPERLIQLRDVALPAAFARSLREGFSGQIDLARAAAEAEAVRLTSIATGGGIVDVSTTEEPNEELEVVA